MYQSSTSKPYMHKSVYIKSYRILLFLTISALILIPLMTHSIQTIWYAATAFYLLIGGQYVSRGVSLLRGARRRGLAISWYTQYPLTLGMACLVLALTLSLEFGIVSILPAAESDLVGNITWIVCGCLFFVLLMLGLHYSRSAQTGYSARPWKGLK